MTQDNGADVPGGYCEDVRFFNTRGPCERSRHYMIPAGPRLPGIMEYIEEGAYVVLHAPRQTGKTTTLYALEQELNASGQYVAVVISCEAARAAEGDYGAAADALLSQISRDTVALGLPPEQRPPVPWPDDPPEIRLQTGLTAWAQSCPLPVVLLLDEIDALRGISLISVLKQIRAGYNARSRIPFPSSIVLCGMRQVRDYKTAYGGNPGAANPESPFNIAVPLRMHDFTREQVIDLYAQHTGETGQEFTPEAIDRAFEYSQGQPWLVNAIAYEITSKTKMGLLPPDPVTAQHVDTAKERLILSRAIHLDSLAFRLREARVRRIIEPLVAGTQHDTGQAEYNDDLSYVRDLGLIAEDNPVRIANPIYKEVIIRVLSDTFAGQVTAEPRTFLLPDGQLDLGRLLTEFAAWWRRNGEWLAKGEAYHEVAPQLIFMAFLQRIVNGGGLVDREYGIGTGRVDLLVRKRYTGPDGKPSIQEEGIELKVRTDKSGDPLDEGLEQLDRYLSRIGLDHGTLLIFDRRASVVRDLPAPEFTKTRSPEGRDITVLTA